MSETEILNKIKFISKVEENQKIDIHSMTISNNTYTDGLTRFLFNSSNRKEVFSFINLTVKDTILLCYNHLQQKSYVDSILKLLDDCKVGICNLLKTYHYDKFLCSQYENLIEIINTNQKKIRVLYENIN